MNAPIKAPIAASKARHIEIADLFCGAGSLSTGANDALIELGYSPEFTAVNHWDVATQTYQLNHPGAKVHCVTLDAALPTALIPKGRLGLLMAGIECTFFSRARGGRPVNDQQRMSAWHVVRWCTELRVKRLLLENVPEFVRWGPVDARNGRPIKSRKGEYFWAWWRALEAIGFDLEMRVLNCADYGDATTRERLFVLGRADGKKIRWPTPTHSKHGDMFGSARWRAAREIIDWSIKGTSIFDRAKPLAPKTLARIAAGLVKFKWPEPFLIVLRRHADARGIELPVPTLCASGTHLGLVEPFVLSNQAGGAPRSIENPVPGMANKVGHALIAPYYGSGSGLTCTSADVPLPAPTTKSRFALVTPASDLAFIPASFGERPTQAPRVHSTTDPVPAICAQGRTNLIEPGENYDILFRMLEPHELAAAMSISTPERPYRFVGNKTEVVRQIGQAVPRRTGYALARTLMEDDK